MPATYQLPYVYRSGGTVIPPEQAGAVHESSNTAVITVNATGLVTAVGLGTATVTTTAGTAPPVVKSFTVIYTAAGGLVVTSGVLSPLAPTITNGGLRQFAAGWLDQNGDPIDDTESWSSSAPAVISIDPVTGLATGEADAGTATITATSASQPSITATTTATAAPELVAMVPAFEWWPAVHGFNPAINDVDAVVNSESFGSGFFGGFEYDRGDGTVGIHSGVQPTGLLALPTGNERNRWTYYLGDRITTTAGEVVTGFRQWDRHTRTAVAGTGWEVRSSLLIGHSQILGGTDTPIRMRIWFRVRGTPGKRLRWYAQQVGGVQLHPVTDLDVFAAGVEQEVSFDFDWPQTLVPGDSIQAYIALMESGTAWVEGDYVEAIDCGFYRAELFDEPDEFLWPPECIKGTVDFRGRQNNLPIHREKGLPIFRNEQSHWPDASVVDLTNVTGSFWTATNVALSVSTDPGMHFSRIPAGNPGRYWFDAVMQNGGTLAKVGTFQLLQFVPPPEYTPESYDTGGNGTLAGRRVWLHWLWRAAPGQTIPSDGDVRAVLTGDAAYTGDCIVIPDVSDGSTRTYHVLFPVDVAANNTAINFSLAFENVSGGTLTFQVGPIWPDREVYNPTNPRNAGSPNQWICPRPFFGAEATGTAATTMRRARIDHGITMLADVFTHTLVRRDFLMWDLEHIRGRPHAQLKWFDSGPNASSALTYLWEIITSAAGVPTFRVYIQHEGGSKGSTVEWSFDVGTPNPFRRFAYNDVAVICDEGAQALYVNGTWYDRDSPNFSFVVPETLGGTPWTLNEFTPVWLSMDRDLDCTLSAFMTAVAMHPLPQTRAAVEGYFASLNADGRVGLVAA